MFSVKGSTSKISWLVYNDFVTTIMIQLNIKTTFVYITSWFTSIWFTVVLLYSPIAKCTPMRSFVGLSEDLVDPKNSFVRLSDGLVDPQSM